MTKLSPRAVFYFYTVLQKGLCMISCTAARNLNLTASLKNTAERMLHVSTCK